VLEPRRSRGEPHGSGVSGAITRASAAAGVCRMAEATEKDWFASTVKPDASVAEYVSAPPRGMTNAPQNPKVRAALLKELTEFAVALDSPVWPPPRQRSDILGPGSLEMRCRLRMPRSPSAPAVFNGLSCPAKYPPPLPQVMKKASPRKDSARRADSAKRGGLISKTTGGKTSSKSKEKRSVSMQVGKSKTTEEPVRTKWVYSSELDNHAKEFEISLEKSGSMRLGITTYGGMFLASPKPGTLFAEWNAENADKKVHEGDRIVEVNDKRDDFQKMGKQLNKAEVWDLKIMPGWTPIQDVTSQSHGCSTALWRTKRTFALEDEGMRIAGTAPPDDLTKALARTALAGAPGGNENWRHPDQTKILARVPSDSELRNAREVLKGQSSLHTAATVDLFRYSADTTAGAPLAIKGAGVATGQPDDIWKSDGAYLQMFHNGALRLVNPSALQPNKEDPNLEKKNKRKGDDALEMGMFKPRYPIDDSLKSVRRLKKQWFPEVIRSEKEMAMAALRQQFMLEEEKKQEKLSGLSMGA